MPLTAFAYALFIVSGITLLAIIAGLLFHKVVGAYIDGSKGCMETILYGGMFVGLVISLILAAHSRFALIVSIILGVLLLAIPFAYSALVKRDDRRWYEERLSRFRDAVESDPANLAARTKLAETLYNMGRLDEAIEEYSEIVKRAPAGRAEAARLDYFVAEREAQRCSAYKCRNCGHVNPSERTRCEECEHDIGPSGLRLWLARRGARKIAGSFAVSLAVFAGLAITLSLSNVGGKPLLIILSLLAVAFGELLYLYRNS